MEAWIGCGAPAARAAAAAAAAVQRQTAACRARLAAAVAAAAAEHVNRYALVDADADDEMDAQMNAMQNGMQRMNRSRFEQQQQKVRRLLLPVLHAVDDAPMTPQRLVARVAAE